MIRRTSLHLPDVTHAIGAALLVSSLLLGPVGTTLAEDGTGAATPPPVNTCALITATYIPGSATPAAGAVNPAAAIFASPAASATPDATPVVTAPKFPTVQTDLTATADALLGCLQSGDAETIVRLTGPAFRSQLLNLSSTVSADEFIALSATAPTLPYTLEDVTDVALTATTEASATVTYRIGDQRRSSRWSFALTSDGDAPVWQLIDSEPMAATAPANAATMSITMQDGSYTISPTEISGSAVSISVSNGGSQEHEVFIVRMVAGATLQDLLMNTGGSFPPGIIFVAQATIPAGNSGTMVLTGLAPGTYTVLDMLPGADGMPNASLGMHATFTVVP